jgi:NAD-dependent deacetylase
MRLHGDILDERWLDTCPRLARGGNGLRPAGRARASPPRVPSAATCVRPGVVWFGEPARRRAGSAERAATAMRR